MKAKLVVDTKRKTCWYHKADKRYPPENVKVVLSPTGKHVGTIQNVAIPKGVGSYNIKRRYTTVRNPSTILTYPEGQWEPSIAIETPLIEEFIKRKANADACLLTSLRWEATPHSISEAVQEEIYYEAITVSLIEIKLENKNNNSDRSRKMWEYALYLCKNIVNPDYWEQYTGRPEFPEDTNLITFWARPEEFKNTVSPKGGKTTEQRYIPLKQLAENLEKVEILNG